ncbi:MAG: hypothetical protein F4047_07880 [Caldilineaceae bacterium SB0670_bin_27]|nr:hypothetical protein [Caldilineaceae bacterium SB0670_bin_27]
MATRLAGAGNQSGFISRCIAVGKIESHAIRKDIDIPIESWHTGRPSQSVTIGRHVHDRLMCASHAVTKGVPLPVVARLLGHRQLRLTLRYAYVGDREVIEAPERIGEFLPAPEGPN